MRHLNYTLEYALDMDEHPLVILADKCDVARVKNHSISRELLEDITLRGKAFDVSGHFKEIIREFRTPEGETPAGFRVEYSIDPHGKVVADLVRDISRDKNDTPRPTKTLFSADSANPYEVSAIRGLISNLTCNPAIIYNLFINNPHANVDGRFQTRDEVMAELGRVLGPGCDISVELNDPFNSTDEEILAEADHFARLLSRHRVVIKVPHTGPVNAGNVEFLKTGDKRFPLRYNEGATKDFFRGHELALMLREHGYRVNFTLMFEPYQTALALQARPYFINSFVMFRSSQTVHMAGLLHAYEQTGDRQFAEQLQAYMADNDYISSKETSEASLFCAYARAKEILAYRGVDGDGLDGVRHNLRVLRQANLPDSRLIICNMQGEIYYPAVDRMLAEAEFRDMADRVVVTAGPELFAQYTSSPLVIQFQRRFMNAANGAK